MKRCGAFGGPFGKCAIGHDRDHNRNSDFWRRSQSTNENDDLGPVGRVRWAENTAVLNTFVSGSARGARGTIRVATSPGLRINPRATGLANHSAGRRKINAAYIIVRSLSINNDFRAVKDKIRWDLWTYCYALKR